MAIDQLLISTLVLAFAGGYCVGWLYVSQKILFWKLQWIKVEHKLAASQLREPRTCSEIENSKTPISQ